MQGFWAAAGRVLSRRTIATLVVLAVGTAVFFVGIGRLEFATGQDSYLDSTTQVAEDNERYQSLFGGEVMIVLFTMDEGRRIEDFLTPANQAQLREIEEELRARDDVFVSVISPLTVLDWNQNLVTSGIGSEILARAVEREQDPALAQLRADDSQLTLARVATAGTPGLDNPEWVKFLLYDNAGFTTDGATVTPPSGEELQVRPALRAFIPDTRHALLGAVMVGNASIEELAAASDAVKEAFDGRTFENGSFVVTGTPTFLTDINDYLQEGMLTLGAIAVVVMLVVLFVAFRVRWRLLPLVAMLVGIIWGFGAFGFTGIGLSLVTISGLPILIGLGIDFAVQVHNRIEEEVVVDHDEHPFAETLMRLGPPLLVVIVAAVIAFLVMLISEVPMIQDFGLLLSIGIVAMLVVGITLPVAVLGARERRKPTTHVAGRGWVERTVGFLGSLPQAAVLPLIVVAVVIPIVGVLVEDRAEVESDPINWADQSSESVVNARYLEDETGFATTLGVFVETQGAEANGVFTDQMASFVHDFVFRSLDHTEEDFAQEAILAEGSSLTTSVSYLLVVPGATFLAPTGLDMLQAYQVAPPDIQRQLTTEDGNATQVLFRVAPSSLDQRSELVKGLQATIADPGEDAKLPANASATPSGLAVIGVELLDNVTSNRAAYTLVALALVAAWLLVRYLSLVRALLTMIPVLLATGTSATLVAVFGITLSPLTTIGGPLVVAICAEISILLVARYMEERERGLSPSEATSVASERTGRAFFTSALTTLGGFAVLMFAALPLLRDFGAIVTLNIATALLSALVVVPPLVQFADNRGWLYVPAAERRAPARLAIAGAAAVVLLVVGFGMVVASVDSDDEAAAAPPATVPATESPATLPPSTTAPPPPTTAEEGGLLPPGPPERPGGLIAGVFYDGLVGAGVDPGVARCAADNLIAKKSEEELLAMGVAANPRPPEVDALLIEAATECGVTAEQLAAAAG